MGFPQIFIFGWRWTFWFWYILWLFLWWLIWVLWLFILWGFIRRFRGRFSWGLSGWLIWRLSFRFIGCFSLWWFIGLFIRSLCFWLIGSWGFWFWLIRSLFFSLIFFISIRLVTVLSP